MSLLSRAAAAVGSLWPLGRASAPPPDDSPEVVDGWIRIYSGDELLARPQNAPFVQKINSNFRGTPSQAFELIDIPLDRFATLVQLLPAAEFYHHPERGGLLLHQLECMAMATDANYQIHQMVDPRLVKDNTPPEFIFFTNYCFHLRALTHDIGKIQTMFNIELLVERADGSFIEKPYDPMEGCFGSICLAARAAREKENGARSVRYRYKFKRSNGIHDHEAFWEAGIQRLLQDLPNPVPGQHASLHLTDSESFRTHLLPKLAEIDRRSVVNYHTRTERSASPEQLLYRQFLHDLATHPQLKSADLVRSSDGEQLLFLPYSVLQVFLNELPPVELYSSVPRHPQQCMYKLKGVGYTTEAFWAPANQHNLNEYNGRSGAFLNADITAAMLGVPFLRRCADNVSARLVELMEAAPSSSPQAVDGAAPATPRRPSPDLGPQTVVAPTRPVPTASRTPQHLPPAPGALRPTSSQTDLDATTASLLGQPAAPLPERPNPAGATRHEELLDAVNRHLESIPAQTLTNNPAVRLQDGTLIFSRGFVREMLYTVVTQANSNAPRKEVLDNLPSLHPDKWEIVKGELVCTSAYTAQLLDGIGSDNAIPAPPPSGQSDLTFDDLLDVAGRTAADLALPPTQGNVHSSTSPVVTTSSSPSTPKSAGNHVPARDRDSEFRSLIACVRTIYQRTGERFLETDGQLARLDFRAVDEYIGDKQKRGRVLEMLRHLGLYIEHKKGVAVFIRPNHPEVQTCLADLQKKR